MLAYLCVIASPDDDLRLGRIINNPPRGIGAKSIETASAIAHENNCSLFSVISKAELYPDLSRAAPRMLLFAGMINELASEKDELAPDLLYDQLVERTGYLRMLEEKHTVEDDARAQNIRELKSSIISYKGETDSPSLEGYLADVALYTDMDNYDENADCVVMMTMHSAKGLEFSNVFVVGCEEGIFPGIKAIGEADRDGGGAQTLLRCHNACKKAPVPFRRTSENALRPHDCKPRLALYRRDTGGTS